MALSLTKQGDVFSLPAPARSNRRDKEFLYFDEGKDFAHRLALRVRENGSRKWIYFYRWGKTQDRYTIGDASNDPNGWTLARARSEARALRAMVDKGINPKTERQKTRNKPFDTKSFKDTVTAYLAKREPHMKPRSYLEAKRHLENHSGRVQSIRHL